MTDLNAAEAAGMIDRAPHHNSIFNVPTATADVLVTTVEISTFPTN